MSFSFYRSNSLLAKSTFFFLVNNFDVSADWNFFDFLPCGNHFHVVLSFPRSSMASFCPGYGF